MDCRLENFIVANSPDGGFLQSVYWRRFQEAVGRKAHALEISDKNNELITRANIFEHTLPMVGKYFYIPRGPIIHNVEHSTHNATSEILKFIVDLIGLAKKNKAGWIRVEPSVDEELNMIEENLPENIKIKKSAVDMQPKEILVLDISKNKEEILAGMKQKTRYNIRLSQKKGVRITCLPAGTAHNAERPLRQSHSEASVTQKDIEVFLKLVKVTARRDRITSHPEGYYRKMFETIPGDILKLYMAEYDGKIIAANLVLFFGRTATYMHGASDNDHRNIMAPYLLQWQAIIDAKKNGCTKYDFGGVKTEKISNLKSQISNSWSGITKFKTGFAPETKPIEFPGCYDIILNPLKYNSYRIIQMTKRAIY